MKQADASKFGPIGVIDVGAHSIRLEIAQVHPGGAVETLEDLTQPIALGRDVFTQGRIRGSNITLAGDVLSDYARTLREYGVRHYQAIATSAAREALNRDLFVSRVSHMSGITLEILEDMQEIRLMYLAVQAALERAGEFDLAKHQVLLCNIGTGSSQVAFVESGRLVSGESIRLGTLRVMEELGQNGGGTRLREVVDPFVSTIIRWVGRITVHGASDSFIGLGSSVRAVACLGSGAPPDQQIVYLSREDFKAAAAEILALAPAEAASKWSLSDTDADSLAPCCVMLEHFFDITDADRLLVPMVNTRDAIIRDILREQRGKADPFIPEIISATENLGEKYHYDAKHARCVTNNALLLFDKLQDFHNLPARARLLLEIAGILHDLGLFISNEQHHKHSRYLVRNSHIPGLSSDEVNLVSVIARYHRKAAPRAQHLEYASLSPEDRLLVYKLAAILRVADALDRSHAGAVPNLRVRVANGALVLSSKSARDFTLERWGLARKADMFEEVFGLRVTLVGEQ